MLTGDYARASGKIVLSPDDRAALEVGSGIRLEVIEARGYSTLQDKRELPCYGHTSSNGATPCMVIPLYSADGETIVYQIRPHTTLVSADGKQRKYLLPPGARLILDVNPIARADVLNPETELWITEGAKKADAGISHGLPCISLSGVDCWRDRNGPLACWEYIPLRGSGVVLTFDGDFRSNPRVYRALQRFAKWLRSKGAIVRFCLLPEGKDGQKVGLDDFFVNGGTSIALRELIADELPSLSLESKLALLPQTDAGNAERLCARFGEDLRYCHTWCSWLLWDGQCWRRDETGKAIESAKLTARRILAEAASTSDDAHRLTLVAWSKKSESRDRLKAMLELAQSLPSISAIADDFDSDEWLLNVSNGTLELQTGYLREPERDDLITKVLLVPYTAQAGCPEWTKFLTTVLPDEDLRSFIQRAAGYSLTGSVRDHVLFFLYGIGRNGKSTFINTLDKLLSGYSCRLRADVIMQNSNAPNKGATPELAALRGIRLAAVSELSDGQKLDEGLIKSLTGGDAISARELYQKPETFQPTHKLWLAGNHKPVIKGSDEGIWRRPKLIPFSVTIPAQECDAHLPDKLDAEVEGILAWLVQGCLDWQRTGLKSPASVEAATEEYRQEMDVLAPFLDEYCAVMPRSKVAKGEMWKAFQEWSEENGEQIYRTQRGFNAIIKRRRGVKEGVSGHDGTKTWFGIGLKTEESRTLDADRLTEQTENLETSPYNSLVNKEFLNNQSAQSAQSALLPFLIVTTETMQQTARSLAEQRTRAHDGNRALAECLGSNKQNCRIDYFGLLAEVALMDALERHGLRPQGYQFYADHPPSEPDFSLCGCSFDVKACLPGKEYVSINAGKHENPQTRPDFYACTLFETESTLTVVLINASDVDAWGKRDGVEKPDGTFRKPYYSIAKSALLPVASLDTFTAATKGKEVPLVWK